MSSVLENEFGQIDNERITIQGKSIYLKDVKKAGIIVERQIVTGAILTFICGTIFIGSVVLFIKNLLGNGGVMQSYIIVNHLIVWLVFVGLLYISIRRIIGKKYYSIRGHQGEHMTIPIKNFGAAFDFDVELQRRLGVDMSYLDEVEL